MGAGVAYIYLQYITFDCLCHGIRSTRNLARIFHFHTSALPAELVSALASGQWKEPSEVVWCKFGTWS